MYSESPAEKLYILLVLFFSYQFGLDCDSKRSLLGFADDAGARDERKGEVFCCPFLPTRHSIASTCFAMVQGYGSCLV